MNIIQCLIIALISALLFTVFFKPYQSYSKLLLMQTEHPTAAALQ